MTSNWIQNNGAKEFIDNLLNQAGAPLELQVTQICNSFCQQDFDRLENAPIGIVTEKIVYSPDNDSQSYREVDQRVQIYDEIELDNALGIQLILNMPIECKYRKDVELFAFELPGGKDFEGFPVSSGLAGSQLFRNLISTFSVLSSLKNNNIVSVEIKDGTTPQKIHKENIIYNAAGSLYDFIQFDIDPYIRETSINSNEFIETLIDKFKQYIGENHYPWWSSIQSWIKKIDLSYFEGFNNQYYSGKRIFNSLVLHLPIICVNGPLYHVNWDKDFQITTYDEIPYCLSTIRKSGWPGSVRFSLLKRTPEVPVIVTNVEGLQNVLELGLKWYIEIFKLLALTSEDTINRSGLESSFYTEITNHYGRLNQIDNYRSDLNLDKWI